MYSVRSTVVCFSMVSIYWHFLCRSHAYDVVTAGTCILHFVKRRYLDRNAMVGRHPPAPADGLPRACMPLPVRARGRPCHRLSTRGPHPGRMPIRPQHPDDQPAVAAKVSNHLIISCSHRAGHLFRGGRVRLRCPLPSAVPRSVAAVARSASKRRIRKEGSPPLVPHARQTPWGPACTGRRDQRAGATHRSAPIAPEHSGNMRRSDPLLCLPACKNGTPSRPAPCAHQPETQHLHR